MKMLKKISNCKYDPKSEMPNGLTVIMKISIEIFTWHDISNQTGYTPEFSLNPEIKWVGTKKYIIRVTSQQNST